MRDNKSFKAPTTTQEEQTVTAGQRQVNMMWETTQSQIARITVYSSIVLDFALCINVFFNKELTANQLGLINLCLQPINLITGIVIGFYFSRTNHTAIGGTGHKPAASSIGTR